MIASQRGFAEPPEFLERNNWPSNRGGRTKRAFDVRADVIETLDLQPSPSQLSQPDEGECQTALLQYNAAAREVGSLSGAKMTSILSEI